MPSTASVVLTSETKGPSWSTLTSPARRPFQNRRRASPAWVWEIAPRRMRTGVPAAGDRSTAGKVSSSPEDILNQYQSVPLAIFSGVVWVGKRSLSRRIRSVKLCTVSASPAGGSRGSMRSARSGSAATSQYAFSPVKGLCSHRLSPPSSSQREEASP